jgi:hypothetical protein
MPMLESKEAVARVLPEGVQANARTVLVWPVAMVVRGTNVGLVGASEDDELR